MTPPHLRAGPLFPPGVIIALALFTLLLVALGVPLALTAFSQFELRADDTLVRNDYRSIPPFPAGQVVFAATGRYAPCDETLYFEVMRTGAPPEAVVGYYEEQFREMGLQGTFALGFYRTETSRVNVASPVPPAFGGISIPAAARAGNTFLVSAARWSGALCPLRNRTPRLRAQ